MKYLFGSMLLLFVIQFSVAQQLENKQLTESVKKINILYPGFELESPVGKATTWGYALGTRFWFAASEYASPGSNSTSHWELDYLNLVPSGELYTRWYYNIRKRAGKHKRIFNNSASYFTAGARIYFDGIGLVNNDYPEDDDIIAGVYAGWGMRRTFGRRILFDMHLVIQPTTASLDEFEVFLIPGIRLGYLLFK